MTQAVRSSGDASLARSGYRVRDKNCIGETGRVAKSIIKNVASDDSTIARGSSAKPLPACAGSGSIWYACLAVGVSRNEDCIGGTRHVGIAIIEDVEQNRLASVNRGTSAKPFVTMAELTARNARLTLLVIFRST
jgi:hypothetical protein